MMNWERGERLGSPVLPFRKGGGGWRNGCLEAMAPPEKQQDKHAERKMTEQMAMERKSEMGEKQRQKDGGLKGVRRLSGHLEAGFMGKHSGEAVAGLNAIHVGTCKQPS